MARVCLLLIWMNNDNEEISWKEEELEPRKCDGCDQWSVISHAAFIMLTHSNIFPEKIVVLPPTALCRPALILPLPGLKIHFLERGWDLVSGHLTFHKHINTINDCLSEIKEQEATRAHLSWKKRWEWNLKVKNLRNSLKTRCVGLTKCGKLMQG